MTRACACDGAFKYACRGRHNISFCHERICNDKNFHWARLPHAGRICRRLSGAARIGAGFRGRGNQPVTALFGDQQFCIGRIGLDFLAQAVNMRLQRVRAIWAL